MLDRILEILEVAALFALVVATAALVVVSVDMFVRVDWVKVQGFVAGLPGSLIGIMRRRVRWLLPVGAFLLGIFVWAYSVSWSPGQPTRWSDLGASIAGGAIIAFTVLVVERTFETEAENRAVKLQIGLEEIIAGVDLRGQDLRNAYWVNSSAQSLSIVIVRIDALRSKGGGAMSVVAGVGKAAGGEVLTGARPARMSCLGPRVGLGVSLLHFPEENESRSQANGIAVRCGRAYVTGCTYSAVYPTPRRLR